MCQKLGGDHAYYRQYGSSCPAFDTLILVGEIQK